MNKQRFFYCEYCNKKCVKKIGLGVHMAKCRRVHGAVPEPTEPVNDINMYQTGWDVVIIPLTLVVCVMLMIAKIIGVI